MNTEENVQEPVPVEELSSVVPPEKPSLEGLLTAMMAELREIKADNHALRQEQVALREKLEQQPLVGPGVAFTLDPSTPAVGDDKYARHATLITRPVQDNPELYKHLISTSDLRLPG